MTAVSIVLPFRNAARDLEECLASIASQTLDEYELVAIDDGSDDTSAEMIRTVAERDGRIILLSPGRCGLVAALNLGVAAARAPLIARMDADDVMLPSRLEKQCAFLRANREIDVVGSQVEIFPTATLLAGYREYLRWQNGRLTPDEIDADLYVESPFAHPSVMIRRDALERAGGYLDGDFPEDYELWLRMAHAGCRMAKVGEVLLRWRDDPSRTSRTDPRYARDAFDRLRARYLAADRRVAAAREIVFWGAGRPTRRRAAHAMALGVSPSAWSEIRSLFSRDFHFIEAPKPELYRISDVAERQNVLADERRTYSAMKNALTVFPRDVKGPSTSSPEEARKLAALGYIGSTEPAPAGELPDPKDGIRSLAPMRGALMLIADGKHAEAAAALQKIVKDNPRFTDAWGTLALEQEAIGRLDDAITSYKAAIRATPSLAPNYAVPLATLLLKTGRIDEAEKTAELAGDVNSGHAHKLIARAAFARHDVLRAEAEARMAMQDSESRGEASILLAQVLVAQRRANEALPVLEVASREAIARGTPVERLDFALGDVLMLAGRRAEAAEAFRREIAHFPGELEPYLNLAALEADAGRMDVARNLLQQVLASNPPPGARAAVMAMLNKIDARGGL
jgi:glycosyltransferase involved in cell wall biosynthesis/Tfp pilus assembly protein PilF